MDWVKYEYECAKEKIDSFPSEIKISTKDVWSSRKHVRVSIFNKNRVTITDINTNEIVLNVEVGDTFRIANEVRDWKVVKNEKGFIEFRKYGNDGRILRTTHIHPGEYLMARTSGEVRNGMFHKIKDMPLNKICESVGTMVRAQESVMEKAISFNCRINGCELYWIDSGILNSTNVPGYNKVDNARVAAEFYPFVLLEDGMLKPVYIVDVSQDKRRNSTVEEQYGVYERSVIKSEDQRFAIGFWGGGRIALFVNNDVLSEN